jgi:starch synthase
MRDFPFDVTISVWNEFWSSHLAAGLHSAGLKVIHQSTTRQKSPCGQFVRNIPATVLNHMAFREILPANFAFKRSRDFIDSGGARLSKKSKVFWGWSGCSLKGLKTAKSERKPAILERGSTHCSWNVEKVSGEYKRLGLPQSEIASPAEIQYDLKEYQIADRICIPSQFVFNTFLEKGIPEDRLFINPYGVDFDFWSARDDAKQREKASFTFLWVAALMPRKGIAILLDAWRKANLKDARLLLVGGVSKSIKHLLKNLPPSITLIPFMDHKSVRQLMSESHAYVLPSFEEGMARSVLEAGAAGLPVLITEETGATDIFKDGRDGWVVPSGDSDHLAQLLTQIHKCPDLARDMGLSAQNSVRPYTWRAYGERAAIFLKTLL